MSCSKATQHAACINMHYDVQMVLTRSQLAGRQVPRAARAHLQTMSASARGAEDRMEAGMQRGGRAHRRSFSMRMPKKRSMEPKMARWIMMGCFRAESASTYLAEQRQGGS